jgi:Spy/CpxP family protein refolding chaperone
MTSKLVAIVLALGLFGAGLVVGLVVTRSGGSTSDRSRSPGMRGSSDRIVERFQKRLDLSPEQTAQIRGILELSRERTDKIRRDGREQIMKVLDEQQRSKFEAMIKKMQERRAKRRERRRRKREQRKKRE